MLAKFLCEQTVKRHPSVRGLRFYVPLHSVDISFSYRKRRSSQSMSFHLKPRIQRGMHGKGPLLFPMCIVQRAGHSR